MGIGRKFYYRREGYIIEVVVREDTGGKVESRKFNATDRHALKSMIYWLRDKYGFCLDVEHMVDKNDDFLNY